MSKKHKHHGVAQLSLADIRARAERASREGRFQQALELAKQIYKAEPTAQNQEFLRKTYLGRARQLRSQSHIREAATVLQVASQLECHDPAWLQQLAEELASSGEIQAAMKIMRQLSDSPAYARVVARAADAAVQQGESGITQLPQTLHAEFNCILKAFSQTETGQDDQARETLQGIGLRSPFMEWKLLIRGLQAFHQKDDVRALENWQRLQTERLPARLAAPLRFLIDPSYRQAQPPETQAVLQKQADRLQGSGSVPHLRTIQAALGGQESLAPAFRAAEAVLPTLRAEAPQVIPRLAFCFFWAIVTKGEFEDTLRFQRVFGAPPEDPVLDRLHALATEHLGDLDVAHVAWQAYERAVASHPAAWPGDQARHARALIWIRMGHNAASVPDVDAMKDLPPFLRDHPSRPKPLPSAEKCFQHALELAPDQLEAHEALFRYFFDKDKDAKAIKAARQLLERFPDHLATLEALGDLYMGTEKYREALESFQRALKLNPLDRKLRSRVSSAHVFNARGLAERGRFDDARAEYQACLAYEEAGPEKSSIYCKWAACEFKAANPTRAEELLQQALGNAGDRLAVAYSMLIEIIRMKLPAPLKKRFDKDFKEALAEAPTGAGAAALAQTTAQHVLAGVHYYGQKTHEKKVLTYLDQARRKADFSAQQLEIVCTALLMMKSQKQLRSYTELGQRRFPDNPHFYMIEAQSYLLQGPMNCPIWKVRPLLEKARQLLEKMPPDSKQKELLKVVQEQLEGLEMLNPFFGDGPMGMFDDIFGGNDDDYEDDDDDDGWDY